MNKKEGERMRKKERFQKKDIRKKKQKRIPKLEKTNEKKLVEGKKRKINLNHYKLWILCMKKKTRFQWPHGDRKIFEVVNVERYLCDLPVFFKKITSENEKNQKEARSEVFFFLFFLSIYCSFLFLSPLLFVLFFFFIALAFCFPFLFTCNSF